VQQFFHNEGVNLGFGIGTGVSAHSVADILVAWQDTNNNTHISDLHLNNHAGINVHDTASFFMGVSMSDMVQLTGVSVTSLASANIHLIA
jgi:hypothetical protein